jgi:hypothetical protein
MPSSSINKYLSSWKEIAQYFGRGVRTVQRWEAELGMPVRRPHGGSRTAVMAVREELDLWMASRPFRGDSLPVGLPAGSVNGLLLDNRRQEPPLLQTLIVQDAANHAHNDLLIAKLGRHLKVETVHNGESALALLKEIAYGGHPAPDLIIIDQALFIAIVSEAWDSLTASSCMRNVQILVRPSLYERKRMIAA